MQIKCPKCSVMLKLAGPPASGTVKCPKCATVLKIGGAAASGGQTQAPAQQPSAPQPAASAAQAQAPQTPAPQAPTAAPVAPAATANPFDAVPGAAAFAAVPAPAAGGVDFGSLPGPAAGMPAGGAAAPQFQQSGNIPAYTPPTANSFGAPDAGAQPQPADGGGAPAAKPKSKSPNKGTIFAAIGAGLAMFAIFGVAGFFVVKSMTDDSGSSGTTAKRDAPKGYVLYESMGVSIFLPRGKPLDDASGDMEYKAIRTLRGTVFMMGAVDVGEQTYSGDALKKKMDSLTKGDFLETSKVERNGYKGVEGVLQGAIRFAPGESTRAPIMNLEVFQDSGRIIVIGVAQGQSSGENTIVGQSLEPELEDTFYNSLKIGPKPEGFSFW